MRFFLLTTVISVLGTAPGIAASSCDGNTVKGDYGFQADGTRAGNGGNEVPYHAVRTATFDGNNKIAGKGIAVIDGKAIEYTLTGTYAVNPDCSFIIDGTQTYAAGSMAPTAYKQIGIVTRGGNEMIAIMTGDGTNQSGRYLRADKY